jgi:DNA topoisomerase-1
MIYLATDPDREGEAIAKEAAKTLGLEIEDYKRLLFYEITPNGIKEALENPISINENLVEAQLSRQVLDKMIGFCLSGLIKNELKLSPIYSSAGRVQSIVLKLITERERLIERFEKEKRHILCAIFTYNKKKKDSEEEDFLSRGEKIIFKQVDDKENIVVYDKKEQAEIISKEVKKLFKKTSEIEEDKNIIPKPPMITSSLLFEAKTQLGFTVEMTTKLSQGLYEGVKISEIKVDENGTEKEYTRRVGLITYPRTDCYRLSKDFLGRGYNYIKGLWGKEYCNFQPF